MRVSRNKELAIALYQAAEGLHGKDLGIVVADFVKILVKEGRLNQVENIVNELTKYTKKQEGITSLEVTSARPLSKKIIAAIEKIWAGKSELTETVDESIIGGIIIKTEDKILDASIIRQIKSLKKSLEK
ncbi:MAG TPA: ATP synthase F1 subunit delta [Patescibacteria group bacterium]|nr:ATP synthase F1 subunit delta [Patescibacteria group bacterium]